MDYTAEEEGEGDTEDVAELIEAWDGCTYVEALGESPNVPGLGEVSQVYCYSLRQGGERDDTFVLFFAHPSCSAIDHLAASTEAGKVLVKSCGGLQRSVVCTFQQN